MTKLRILVSATGIGKMLVAARDYRRIAEQLSRPRLLSDAHDAQALRQAMRAYREVLRDHYCAVILVRGSQATQHDHLFAFTDSVSTRVNRTGFAGGSNL